MSQIRRTDFRHSSLNPPGNHTMQTNRRLPSLNGIILSVLGFLGFMFIIIEGRQCGTPKDCMGDYRRCCKGYCRRSCNLTCSRDERCGSPGSIEEYCCKGRCISTSILCEKPIPDEEDDLSNAVIAVIAIFGLMFVVALTCVLRSYLCKFRAICCGNSGSQQAQIGSKACGGNGFVELGQESVGTDERLIHAKRISAQTNHTWVGQDFRIVPPKSSSSRKGRKKTSKLFSNVTVNT